MNIAEEKLVAALGVEPVIFRTEIKHGVLQSVVVGMGEDILLLHGVNIGWGQWYPNIAELAKHFRVHAIDLPGSGNSTMVHPWAEGFDEILVNAVGDYLDSRGIKKAHIIGHSLGAWVAMKIMLGKPAIIDKVVLISPLGFSKRTPYRYRLLGLRWLAELLSKTAMRPTKKNIEKFLKGVFYDKKKLTPELVDYYYRSLVDNRLSHPFLWMNRFAGIGKVRNEFVLFGRIKEMGHPMLIAIGKYDPIVSFGEGQKKEFAGMPNITLKYFDQSGHVPAIEQAELFNEMAITFLTT